jgi:hypothetical protein
MDRGDSRGRPGDGKRRPELHEPRRNRASYLVLYRAVRKFLGMGATAAQIREAFELAAASRWPWETTGRDDYERENIDSIKSRALEDAIQGRPPCLIWGLHEPEQAGG